MTRVSVDILIASITKDDTGREVKTWPVDDSAIGNFQPVRYNAGNMPYGVTDKTSDVFYCKEAALLQKYLLLKDDPEQFNITNRIGYNNKYYVIDSILPYNHHLEIYLELVT
jgi:hypothetical protein